MVVLEEFNVDHRRASDRGSIRVVTVHHDIVIVLLGEDIQISVTFRVVLQT
jgi:hypothetical protein